MNRFTFFQFFLIKNWIHYLPETIESIGFEPLVPLASGEWWQADIIAAGHKKKKKSAPRRNFPTHPVAIHDVTGNSISICQHRTPNDSWQCDFLMSNINDHNCELVEKLVTAPALPCISGSGREVFKDEVTDDSDVF
ncbi:hypothetical protein [Pseudomonas sp. MHK4]